MEPHLDHLIEAALPLLLLLHVGLFDLFSLQLHLVLQVKEVLLPMGTFLHRGFEVVHEGLVSSVSRAH